MIDIDIGMVCAGLIPMTGPSETARQIFARLVGHAGGPSKARALSDNMH